MLGNLSFARYRFTLEAASPIRLSHFAGNTLRGGFGHIFKRAVCVWPPADCPRCLLKYSCSYPYIFETAPPPGAEKLRNIDQIPRPFVIEPPDGGDRRFVPGQRFDFHLVLFGRGVDYLPYFVLVFTQLGQTGLGAGRGQYRIHEIHDIHPIGAERIFVASDGKLLSPSKRLTVSDLQSPPLPSTKEVGTIHQPLSTIHQSLSSIHHPLTTIHFLSPTRIKTEGSWQRDITFQDLVRALLRRLSSLCYFHGGYELDVDFKGMIDRAGNIKTVRSQLRWQDQDRFSGRQHQRIEMGGVVGEVTYEAQSADEMAEFVPLLLAGEWTHVGKGAVMGMGRIKVELGTKKCS